MKKYLVPITVTLLCLIMGSQMLALAIRDDSTLDEPIHILSGYTTITQAHALFDPEHPFLAKTLAAIPLLFIHPNVPYAASHLTPAQAQIGYNTYKEANLWGFQMLYMSGNNPDQLLFLTRSVIIVLTILLALAIYFGTKSLFGTASALAALVFIAFEPSFITHGHLANDDTVATLFFVITVILFCHYLRRPTWKLVILTGISFGLGLLTKYSLLLLAPSFVALLLLWLVFQRQHERPVTPPIFNMLQANWQRYTASLLAIFVIAWVCVWVGYGSLAIINPGENPLLVNNLQHLSPPASQIIPLVAPAMYFKGAWLLFDPSIAGRHGYLLGACYTGGRWDYFPVTGFFKTPLPITMLFLGTLALWWKKRKQLDFAPIVLLLGIGLYLVFSMQSNINIGFRHALPMYALAIIAASYPFSLVNWRSLAPKLASIIKNMKDKTRDKSENPRSKTAELKYSNWFRISSFKFVASTSMLLPVVLILSVISVIATGILAYPNDLSYYNLLSGEPRPIPYISGDSNIDWGQGSKILHSYMQQHLINHIAFDNFTGTTFAEAKGLPISQAEPSDHHYHGYLALSRSTIIDHICTKNNNWGWVVDNKKPVAIIGGSINLYKL